MKQKTAVLMINFKGLVDTQECLDSLMKTDGFDELGIYIANYGEVGQEATLLNHRSEPQVITFLENLGFAGFNNRLIERAKADDYTQYILLNNDTTVAPDFIEPLLKRLHEAPALVSPKIYFYPGNEFHAESYTLKERGKVIWYAGGCIDWQHVLAFHRGVDEVDRGQFDALMETDFATGCCTAVSLATLEKIGLMNEKLFMYMEDVDWSVRAWNAKVQVLYEPTSTIWHKNASSSGGAGSSFHQYYQQRNRVWLAMKHADLKTRLAVLKQGLSSHEPMYQRATRDALTGKMGRRQVKT